MALWRTTVFGLAFAGLVACGEPPQSSDTPPATSETPDTPTPPPAANGSETHSAENSESNSSGERIDLPPLGAPAIWTLADADTTVHLFGTVHILKPDVEWRTAELDAALNASDAIYFEADVASPEAAQALAALVPRLGVFTDGTKLTDLLSPAELKEVEEAADIVGLPVSALDPLKPWLASVQLSVLSLQKQGYAQDSGVETVLTGLAEDAGTPLRFLETGEDQLNFFADLSIDDQIDFLVTSAIQIEDEPDMLDQLVDEWAEGDIDDLGEMLAAPDVMGSSAVYDSLIVTRNANWTDQIETLLAQEAGTFLIAVGAAHLAGDDSVVEMLRLRGIDVSGP